MFDANDMIQRVKTLRANIVKLNKVLKDMDPASGVAISIRRGVARDNDDVENDDELRPWTTVECTDMAAARVAIGCAIKAAEESIQFWGAAIQHDYDRLGQFIDSEKQTAGKP